MFKYFMFNMFSFVFKSRVDYLNIVLVIILSRIQFGLFYFIFIILLHFIFGRPKAQAQEQGQIGAQFQLFLGPISRQILGPSRPMTQLAQTSSGPTSSQAAGLLSHVRPSQGLPGGTSLHAATDRDSRSSFFAQAHFYTAYLICPRLFPSKQSRHPREFLLQAVSSSRRVKSPFVPHAKPVSRQAVPCKWSSSSPRATPCSSARCFTDYAEKQGMIAESTKLFMEGNYRMLEQTTLHFASGCHDLT